MKVVILAGGFGARISEESHLRPKPMIEIGEKPILWHIMKFYSAQGFDEFIICCGYKAYVIKEYFANYYLHNSDVTFDFCNAGHMEVHTNTAEPWKVTLVDTGLNTMTGGRVKRIQPYVGTSPFLLTYGDGVSDVNIPELLAFHKKHSKVATITAVQAEQRFGILNMNTENTVETFREKAANDCTFVNGGFMVLEPAIFDYIEGDDVPLERAPLEQLAREGNLKAYKHTGYWQCMDTLQDKKKLEEIWRLGTAPWKLW